MGQHSPIGCCMNCAGQLSTGQALCLHSIVPSYKLKREVIFLFQKLVQYHLKYLLYYDQFDIKENTEILLICLNVCIEVFLLPYIDK